MKNILKKLGNIVSKPFRFAGRLLKKIFKPLMKGQTLIARFLRTLAKPFLFLREAIRELSFVTWLTKKNTLKFSIQILLLMIVATVGIAALDLVFFKGLKYLLS